MQGESVARRVAAAPPSPLEYYGVLGTVQAALERLSPPPVVVSEGANTMDMARLLIPVKVGAVHIVVGRLCCAEYCSAGPSNGSCSSSTQFHARTALTEGNISLVPNCCEGLMKSSILTRAAWACSRAALLVATA